MSVCPHCTNGVVELLFSRRACEYCAGGEGVTAPTVNRATPDPGRTRTLPSEVCTPPAFGFPEGSHECTVVGVEQRVSKTGRPTMLAWTLRTDAGTDHRLFQALSGPNMWAIAESAKACGLGNGEALDHAVGRRVRIESKGDHCGVRWHVPDHNDHGEVRRATLQLIEENTGRAPLMLRVDADFVWLTPDNKWVLAEDIAFPQWLGMLPFKVAAVFVDDQHKVPLDSSIYLSEGDSARFAAGSLTVSYLW